MHFRNLGFKLPHMLLNLGVVQELKFPSSRARGPTSFMGVYSIILEMTLWMRATGSMEPRRLHSRKLKTGRMISVGHSVVHSSETEPSSSSRTKAFGFDYRKPCSRRFPTLQRVKTPCQLSSPS